MMMMMSDDDDDDDDVDDDDDADDDDDDDDDDGDDDDDDDDCVGRALWAARYGPCSAGCSVGEVRCGPHRAPPLACTLAIGVLVRRPPSLPPPDVAPLPPEASSQFRLPKRNNRRQFHTFQRYDAPGAALAIF